MSPISIAESPQYLALADKIGQFIEYWGFKQVHGKIWTLIFLSPEPVDANFLKKTLKISKALTSMSLKDLLQYNVIEEVAKDKPGTQKYRINPDITEVILGVIRQREFKMLSEIKVQCEKLEDKLDKSKNSFIDIERMKELSEMVSMAHTLLKGMAAGDNVDFGSFNQVMTIKL